MNMTDTTKDNEAPEGASASKAMLDYRDAERYRWIRRNAYEFSFVTDAFDWTGGMADQLDAAIDEAIEESNAE